MQKDTSMQALKKDKNFISKLREPLKIGKTASVSRVLEKERCCE